jgi:hypothetical protein
LAELACLVRKSGVFGAGWWLQVIVAKAVKKILKILIFASKVLREW